MRKILPAVSIAALLLWSFPAMAGEGTTGPGPGGKWEEFSLSFRLLPETNLADERPMQVGMKLELPSPSGGFAVQAEGGNVQVDVNGDGTLDQKVKEGQPVYMQVKYENGEALQYALRFIKGKGMAWFYETATSMSGKVLGESFALIDANCNGKFDDMGKDAVLIGKARWAIPLGKIVSIKDKLYHLKVDPLGKSASVQEYTGEVGTLDLVKNFKAPSGLLFAVVQGGDSFFELSSKGGAKVPAGKYAFVKGRLEKARKSCSILRGEWKEIEVMAAGTTQPEWGPPLKIVFKPTMSGEKLHIDISLQLFGKAGEQYIDFQDTIMAPEIQVKSKDGSVALKARFATG